MSSGINKTTEFLPVEAKALGQYLSGKAPGPALCERYINMVSGIPLPTPEGTWLLALRHKWFLALLDGGTAFLKKDCPARKRLQIMHALLECDTEQAGIFLSKKQKGLQLLKIGFYAFRGIACAVTGAIVVKVLSIK